MKRRITLSITLVLSVVLLSLMSSDSTAKAEPEGRRVSFDTGIVTLGPGQKLRVAVVGDFNRDNDIRVRFRRMGYIEQDNLYKVASEVTTDPITLAPGEGAVIDITLDRDMNAVRGIVNANLIGTNAAGTVTVQIIDATGQVDSILIALLVP